MRICSKVHVAATHFLPLYSAIAPQSHQNPLAPAAELFPQHLRTHTCRTASDQGGKGIGQTACTGKTYILVKPKPVSSESRDRTKGVPSTIVSEAAVISYLGQKASEKGDGVVHLGSQRLDHPAWGFGKKGNKALAWWGGGCQGGP